MPNLYAQVLNDELINLWSSPPRVPLGTDGWRHAIEVYPEIDSRSQYYDGHTLDITDDLVTLTHIVKNTSVDSRKDILITKNDEDILNFMKVASSLGTFSVYTSEEIVLERQKAESNKTMIQNATTHEELNSLVLEDIRKY